MSEGSIINAAYMPLTVETLAEQLAACGLAAGQTVVVHSSLSRLGWIVGGPVTVIRALLRVLTPAGTLMMPTHTNGNTNPANWQNPPVPPAWWPLIREHMPAYDPAITPTRQMGAVAEAFRTWPGAIRSAHPIGSFAAFGPHAADLTADHRLEEEFGDASPIGRLYELDGHILLLGVDHNNNTALHLAEHRANWPGKRYNREGTAMLVDGVRRWVEFDMLDLNTDDFAQIGDSYEAQQGFPRHRVGQGEARFMRQRPLVDYAVQWMEKQRR